MLTVNEQAQEQIKKLIQSDGDLKLRVYVEGGGCSGFKYGFGLDKRIGQIDQIYEFEGFSLVVDQFSAMYLQGATLDYVENLFGRNFVVKNNQNVSNLCSCGASFDV